MFLAGTLKEMYLYIAKFKKVPCSQCSWPSNLNINVSDCVGLCMYSQGVLTSLYSDKNRGPGGTTAMHGTCLLER